MIESFEQLKLQINQNIRRIQAEIAIAAAESGRQADDITLMAVTKGFPAGYAAEAAKCGITTFGENRVQEALAKSAALPNVRWEMIGTLQRNKVKNAVTVFQRIQSIDSIELAQALNNAAQTQQKQLEVLIQVNISGEASKHGVSPDMALRLGETIQSLPFLHGTGLMTIAPFAEDPQTIRWIFAELRAMRDTFQAHFGASWQTLSMGMSHDFTAAIAEGATLVRIGTALFGGRIKM